MGSIYARRDQVKPGGTSRFDLFFYDTGLGEAEKFDLWVEGYPVR